MGGIIPARAGFTSPHPVLPLLRADHPRSRGVYRMGSGTSDPRLGSSPLARGLPDTDLKDRFKARIIPARAGFTMTRILRPATSPDHPRSRGVYHATDTTISPRQGSSPLARGLPGADLDGLLRQVDHPRSRGVYRPSAPLTGSPGGSSPLARGLPADRRRPRFRSRDHPRSRGVYTTSPRGRPPRRGSSPLARGLPNAHGTHLRDDGIIPARAGFTWPGRRSEPCRWDHPRSRGVYVEEFIAQAIGAGSSPLARGLPGGLSRERAPARIIPARAGFT